MARRITKYLLLFLAVIAGAVAVFFILLQTSWLRGNIQGYVLEGINSSITGRISAETIQGDLFSHIVIRNVALSLDGEMVCKVGTIELEYDVMGLLSRQIFIHALRLDSVRVRIVEDDGWNIEKALTSREPVDSTTGGDFDWTISVDTLTIGNSMLTATTNERVTTVDRLAFLGSGTYRTGSAVANVMGLSFVVDNPSLEVTQCVLNARVDSETAAVDNFMLGTRGNRLEGSGRYLMNESAAEFEFRSDSLDFTEFESLIGKLPAHWRPSVRADGNFRDGEMAAVVTVSEGSGTLNSSVSLRTDIEPMSYAAKGTLDKFDVDDLIDGGPELSHLQGEFAIQGSGFDVEKMSCGFEIDLTHVRVNKISAEVLSAEGKLERNTLQAQVRVNSKSGSVDIGADVSDLTGVLRFAAEGRIEEIDIEPLAGIQSNVSGNVAMSGIGKGEDGPEVSFQVRGDSSSVDSIGVSGYLVAGEFSRGTLRLDSLIASRSNASLLARGSIDTTIRFNMECSLNVADISVFMTPTEADSLKGSVAAKGSVWGTPDALDARVTIRGSDIVRGSDRIGNFSVFSYASLSRDTVFNIWADSLMVGWDSTTWVNGAPIAATIGQDGFRLEPMRLVSGEQSIEGGGVVEKGVLEDVYLQLDRFEIQQVARTFLDMDASGKLDLSFKAEGSREHPQAEFSLGFDNGMRNGVALPSIVVNAAVADSVLLWDANVRTNAGEIVGEGTIPVTFADTTGSIVDEKRSLHAIVKTNHLDLSLLGLVKGTPVTVAGFLDGNLTIEGTVKSPEVEGFVRLDSASVTHPGSGLALSGIRLTVTGNKDSLLLQEFSIGEKGLTGQGSAAFRYVDSLIIEPHITLQARDFELLAGPAHYATISGDVSIESDRQGGIVMDGDITLQRSRFYLPALRGIQTTSDPDPPMLLIAAGRVDTAFVLPADSIDAGPRVPKFSGRVNLKIPRATWLRGPRMNVELSGNLEATSSGSILEIRGFLVVEQGTYEFYGRRFDFTQGRIDFDGDMNPVVYFEVEYPFRTEEVENRLVIVVRGQSRTPTIEFFFNKDPISESDAISYIVFGRKVDDLNYGQKSTVTDLGDALAKDLAANMINSQLSSLVGSTLGLDVVRISGEENWNKAVLTAGKYVTDDVFVAYERGISQSGSSSVVFESARLEYYLMKFLYLHLIEATDKTSGVDVFLKFD